MTGPMVHILDPEDGIVHVWDATGVDNLQALRKRGVVSLSQCQDMHAPHRVYRFVDAPITCLHCLLR